VNRKVIVGVHNLNRLDVPCLRIGVAQIDLWHTRRRDTRTRQKKIREAVRGALMAATVLISAKLSPAQDKPMGDVAREARAEKSQAPHANKVVTNEDLGPQLGPVSETDDPAKVVKKARRAWVADRSAIALAQVIASKSDNIGTVCRVWYTALMLAVAGA